MKNLVNRFWIAGILCSFAMMGTFLRQACRGAEEYAGLIEKDTMSMICVDVEKVNLSTLTAKVSEIAMNVVDKVVQKPEEKNQMRLAVPALIAMAIAPYTPLYQGLKDNGVDKFYAVPTPKNAEISPFYVAIPVGQKSNDQQQAIKELSGLANDIGLNFRMPFVRHGYIFFVFFSDNAIGDDAIKSYIKGRFMKFDTAEKPLYQAGFEKIKGGSVGIVNIADPKQIEEGYKQFQAQSTGNEAVDQFLKENLPEIMQKVFKGLNYGAYKIDLDEPSLVWYGNLKDRSGGEKFINDLPGLASKVGGLLKGQADPELADIVEKLIVASKPEIQGDDLVWKLNPSYFRNHQELFNRLFKKTAAMQAAQGAK
ncbi:MAG: hypothetical protein Q4G69_00400 [Planctomycetia bacterium]|nr:hypothetical protein [Planctomycetia bacterium]